MASRIESVPTPNLPGYVFGEKLGAGSYGTVYKAKILTNRTSADGNVSPAYCAIKCIMRRSLNKMNQDLLINEIKLLKNIKHKNIVEMYDFRWDENYIYIVMEYCAGGDMSKFIHSRQRLSEARARPFVQQIARVIEFLHLKRISHMDLKPENILLTSTDDPTVKVADFGVAQHIGKHGSRSIRGTLLYMAPEILSETPYDGRVDLWSIGVILYECLFGRPLFVFSTVDDLIEQIKSRVPIEIPDDAQISADCRDLLVGLLKRNPNNRISFRDFFHHPFIVVNLSAQLNRAEDLFQRSVQHEQNGNLKKALEYRVRALDEFLALLKVDQDSDRCRTIRARIKAEVVNAEKLKRQIRESTPSSPPTASSSVPRTTTTNVDTSNLDLTNDKALSNAYQHCLNGNQLMNSLHYGRACEEYQIGLTVMLNAARSETDPTKSKILHNMISIYLDKAEQCKNKDEAQQLDFNMAKIKDDPVMETTIVEKSTEKSDKRTFSVPPQNCSVQ